MDFGLQKLRNAASLGLVSAEKLLHCDMASKYQKNLNVNLGSIKVSIHI